MNRVTQIDGFRDTRLIGPRIGSKVLARIMAALPANAKDRIEQHRKLLKGLSSATTNS